MKMRWLLGFAALLPSCSGQDVATSRASSTVSTAKEGERTSEAITESNRYELVSNMKQRKLRVLDDELTDIYFIGDLHGDVGCARQWVERTGAIDFGNDPFASTSSLRSSSSSSTPRSSSSSPELDSAADSRSASAFVTPSTGEWRWTGGVHTALVFLGDFVDKGPDSRAVLEFMRGLCQRFPNNVVTVLGNHDLFLLLDAVLADGYDRPMGRPTSEYVYSFNHPQTFLQSGWSPTRADDSELLAAILDAHQEVYARHLEGRMRIAHLFAQAPPFRDNRSLAKRAQERLHLWQKEWANGLVQSGLADWLAGLPIVLLAGDALVVHAGIPLPALNSIAAGAPAAGKTVGEMLHSSANEALWYGFQNYGNGQIPGSSSLFPEHRVESNSSSHTGTPSRDSESGISGHSGSNSSSSSTSTDSSNGDSSSGSSSSDSTTSSSDSSNLPDARTIEEDNDSRPFAFKGAFSVHADFDEVVGSSEAGDLIGHLVQHRGFFYKHKGGRNSKKAYVTDHDHGGAIGCTEVAAVVNALKDEGVARIVVGHTPGDEARELCSGTLLAADSSLSRPFRAFGNMYCAPDKVDEKGEVLGEKDSKSRSHAGDRGGSAVTGGSAIGDAEDKLEMAAQRARTRAAAGCDAPVEESCEGSIARLSRSSPLVPWPTYAEIIDLQPVGRGGARKLMDALFSSSSAAPSPACTNGDFSWYLNAVVSASEPVRNAFLLALRKLTSLLRWR